MRSLRSRFILSHLLPILVIIPLMGIALVYLLETQVLLENLSTEVTGEAVLVAKLASLKPEVWINPSQAQSFVSNTEPILAARIEIIDAQGRLEATSDPADLSSIGQVSTAVGLTTALQGKVDERVFPSQKMSSNVVDVLVPVIETNGQILGVVRLTHSLSSVVYRFMRLRYLISGVVAGGLLLGVALGWLLALELEQPLGRVTRAVISLARGERQGRLPEQGPNEIRSLMEAVNSLVDRLNGLELARRRLLANLVHELGRPLGALRSAVQALQGGAAADEGLRQELLTGMDAEISSLKRLLEDLSRLYDQLIGPLELDLRPVTISEWLPPLLAPWREAAQIKRLLWESPIPADLPTLNIDVDRMAQAVENLLSNAIKYTPAGGKVSITAGVAGTNALDEASGLPKNNLWIRVEDTGPGISEKERDLVFTAFYRGPETRRFPQGMGLGLTIAQDMVTAHGGKITLESTLGMGSVFTIWLPISHP
jgi:two-component system, OmpR family, sensor histidine kinase BaeS